MKRTLLLNSDWSPLNFVSGFRALNLLNRGRAEVIFLDERPSLWDEKVSTPTTAYDLPATLRLVERVNKRYNASPRFRKWALFNRDNWQCQYCSIQLEWSTITIDHVTPSSRGGTTSWRNCVASCKKCNMKKGSRLPTEAGMQLNRLPVEPKLIHFWEVRRNSWHPDWHFFFASDGGRT